MTAHKHFKQLVRARMLKTGESYASARRQVIDQPSAPPADPASLWHFPGSIPATTALRVLTAHAGVRAPHTGAPYSEAMLFGIAGGVGAGVFSFVYEKEDFASFFVAGRHNWQDDAAYLNDACRRLGLEPVVQETGGEKAAEAQLRKALTDGPCVAWVDMAHLPHRALPPSFSGGGYHVIAVYRINDASGTALIGDLADEPIEIALKDLAQARARIKKQKNRVLTTSGAPEPRDLKGLVREGLRECHVGRPGIGTRVMVNFTLEAFRVWGERMLGSRDKERWDQVFPRGGRLWQGLTSMYDSIELYGTGGGLCRPIFAEFLAEAAEAIGASTLQALGEQYADLGRRWTELANSALPDSVPQFREAKELLVRRAELTVGDGGRAIAELGQAWTRRGELAAEARRSFPLTHQECEDLRAHLQSQILALYEDEVKAHGALGAAISSF